MELYQLKSFLEVARVQNLTRAASNLHISQSALSSQIKLLEEEFGLLLFSRTSKGMLLTDQGRVLQSYASGVVTSSEELIMKAKEMAGKVSGTFRVGVNTDGGFLKISKLSRQLITTFPEVNFIFVSSGTIRTPEMLRQGHIDLGFFFGDHQTSDLTCERIGDVTIRVVIPEKIHSQQKNADWVALAKHPWIWSVCDCPYYQIVQAEFDWHGVEPNKIVDAMDESVVKELVKDGQGLAIMRQDDAEEVIRDSDTYIWDGASFEVPLSIGVLKNRLQDPTVIAVSDLIKTIWVESL